MQEQDGVDHLTNNWFAITKLRFQCEQAKKILSTELSARIKVDNLVEAFDFDLWLTRTKLEELMMPIIERCLDQIDKAMIDS